MPASLQSAVLGPREGITRWAITLPEELRSRRLYPPAETDAGLSGSKTQARTPEPENRAGLVAGASLSTISRAF
jgi:hypothetical protein